MPLDFVLSCFGLVAFCVLGVPPFAIVRFLWARARETDAEKAQRLVGESQRLLEEARQLATQAQRAGEIVDAEFERRLRIVSGESGRGD